MRGAISVASSSDNGGEFRSMSAALSLVTLSTSTSEKSENALARLSDQSTRRGFSSYSPYETRATSSSYRALCPWSTLRGFSAAHPPITQWPRASHRHTRVPCWACSASISSGTSAPHQAQYSQKKSTCPDCKPTSCWTSPQGALIRLHCHISLRHLLPLGALSSHAA